MAIKVGKILHNAYENKIQVIDQPALVVYLLRRYSELNRKDKFLPEALWNHFLQFGWHPLGNLNIIFFSYKIKSGCAVAGELCFQNLLVFKLAKSRSSMN